MTLVLYFKIIKLKKNKRGCVYIFWKIIKKYLFKLSVEVKDNIKISKFQTCSNERRLYIEPCTVQTLVLRDLTFVWEHCIPGDHSQHHLPGNEVLPPAGVVHRLPRRAQSHLHLLLRRGVHSQVRGFQVIMCITFFIIVFFLSVCKKRKMLIMANFYLTKNKYFIAVVFKTFYIFFL